MEQLELFSTGESTSSQGARLVSQYLSRGKAKECAREAAQEARSPSTSRGLPASCDPDGLYGRTWRTCCLPNTQETFSTFSQTLGTAGILSRGGCWTRSMCEWTGWSVPSRRDGGVCGLSDVLEPMSPRLRKYFLSPTALRGILRRADARGKALPTLLRDAIEWMLGWWETQPDAMSSTSKEARETTA